MLRSEAQSQADKLKIEKPLIYKTESMVLKGRSSPRDSKIDQKSNIDPVIRLSGGLRPWGSLGVPWESYGVSWDSLGGPWLSLRGPFGVPWGPQGVLWASIRVL